MVVNTGLGRSERGYSILEVSMLLVVLLPVGLAVVGIVDYILKSQTVSYVVDKYVEDSLVATFSLSSGGQLAFEQERLRDSVATVVNAAAEEIEGRMATSGVRCSCDGAAFSVNYDPSTGVQQSSGVITETRAERGTYAGTDYFRLDRELAATAGSWSGKSLPTGGWHTSSSARFLPRTILVGLRVACDLSDSGTAVLLRHVSSILPELEEVKVVQLRGEVS